ERFKTVFKQSILDQTQGLRTTFRSARNTLNEAIEGGTLEGTRVGNFKRIRTFKTVVDPVTGVASRVAGSKQVYRETYLGTSLTERISQFRQTWSSVKVSDRIKTVKSVEETTLDTG